MVVVEEDDMKEIVVVMMNMDTMTVEPVKIGCIEIGWMS